METERLPSVSGQGLCWCVVTVNHEGSIVVFHSKFSAARAALLTALQKYGLIENEHSLTTARTYCTVSTWLCQAFTMRQSAFLLSLHSRCAQLALLHNLRMSLPSELYFCNVFPDASAIS